MKCLFRFKGNIIRAWVAPNINLKDKFLQQNYKEDLGTKVRDLVNIEGDWNWSLLKNNLDQDTLACIQAIPPPRVVLTLATFLLLKFFSIWLTLTGTKSLSKKSIRTSFGRWRFHNEFDASFGIFFKKLKLFSCFDRLQYCKSSLASSCQLHQQAMFLSS